MAMSKCVVGYDGMDPNQIRYQKYMSVQCDELA
jgi:hypothetical protein